MYVQPHYYYTLLIRYILCRRLESKTIIQTVELHVHNNILQIHKNGYTKLQDSTRVHIIIRITAKYKTIIALHIRNTMMTMK